MQHCGREKQIGESERRLLMRRIPFDFIVFVADSDLSGKYSAHLQSFFIPMQSFIDTMLGLGLTCKYGRDGDTRWPTSAWKGKFGLKQISVVRFCQVLWNFVKFLYVVLCYMIFCRNIFCQGGNFQTVVQENIYRHGNRHFECSLARSLYLQGFVWEWRAGGVSQAGVEVPSRQPLRRWGGGAGRSTANVEVKTKYHLKVFINLYIVSRNLWTIMNRRYVEPIRCRKVSAGWGGAWQGRPGQGGAVCR